LQNTKRLLPLQPAREKEKEEKEAGQKNKKPGAISGL